MGLFKRKKEEKPVSVKPVLDLDNDPTTIEVKEIKKSAHQDIDAANAVVDKFKKRVKVENHFTVQIIHLLGGKQ